MAHVEERDADADDLGTIAFEKREQAAVSRPKVKDTTSVLGDVFHSLGGTLALSRCRGPARQGADIDELTALVADAFAGYRAFAPADRSLTRRMITSVRPWIVAGRAIRACVR